MRSNHVIHLVKILLTVFVVLCIKTVNVCANTFGQSCSTLPILDQTNYLIHDTAYGYVQKSLDMKTHVTDACKPEGNELKFCIINNIPNPICTPKTMKIGSTAKLGALTTNTDITTNPSLANIALSVAVIENKVCLTMPTSRGPVPLICRDSAPVSVMIERALITCKSIGNSCYDGKNKSQSLLNFSGLTINCLKDTLNKVFYLGNDCPIAGEDLRPMTLRAFPEFQDFMRNAVRAALILYVMIFGFKTVMNNEYAQLDKIALFIAKFILVTYFAIGLGAKTIVGGKEVQNSGMTEFALPLLVNLTSNFTEYVFLAGGASGLCNFDRSKYDQGYEFYKVWDAIDCRIGYYLGMQLLYNVGTALTSLTESAYNVASSGSKINWGPPNKEAIDTLSKAGSLTFFTVMFGFFMKGQIIIVIMGVVFAIVFISMLLYFLTAYLVCMVTLYVLAYIGPIFIPMALFERTKSYFDSWLKLVISCTLQPAVIGGFIALLLTVYDTAIYGNCEYKRHDYSVGEYNFSTFELMLPTAEVAKCEASLGYKLMKYYLGYGWEKKALILFEISGIHDYLNISLSLLYVIIYIIVFYYFMQSVNQFASDLVGGPNLASVTVSPNSIVDKVKDAASMLASLATSKGRAQGINKGATAARGAADKISSGIGGRGATDKASVGSGGEAKDSVSTSRGEGGGS